MHAQLEELWIDAMEMKVGEQITAYLRKNHPEYQEIEARQKKLIEDYPMLWKVVDGDDPGFRQDGQRSDHPYQGKCQTHRAGTGIQAATKSKISRQAVGEESTPDHKVSDRAGKYHAKDIICTEKGTGGQGCKADCHP